jgi:hypothetical protein
MSTRIHINAQRHNHLTPSSQSTEQLEIRTACLESRSDLPVELAAGHDGASNHRAATDAIYCSLSAPAHGRLCGICFATYAYDHDTHCSSMDVCRRTCLRHHMPSRVASLNSAVT